MKLSTWWQLLGFYEVLLVWPLVLVTLYLTLTARTRRGRIAGVSFLVLWLMPFIHRAIGDAYFDYLCKHEAGEFIYRTADNVEGILQMRPRDGSKDYFDRMAEGDIPEDPWGHTNTDAQNPWHMLGSYTFVETVSAVIPSRYQRSWYSDSMFIAPRSDQKYASYYGYDRASLKSIQKQFSENPRSAFGYTWHDRTTLLQRVFNIHAGEILAIELGSTAVLGRSAGFYRSRPRNICPNSKVEEHIERFLVKVLRPRPYASGEKRQ